MRVDFNVPLEGSKITDDRRIVQAMPTIKSVVERGGRLILMSHLGRPKGGPEPKYSLAPVAKRLGELVNQCQAVPHPHGEGRNVADLHLMKNPDEKAADTHARVRFVSDCVGPDVEKAANELKDGDVLLLENLRFHKGEEKNETPFAQQLAKLGDVYVNDAFGTAHREHASTFGVPQLMQGKPRVIGFLIQKELKFLGERSATRSARSSRSSAAPRSRTRSASSRSSSAKADTLLIGGAMAYTFFLAQGKQVGKSLVERDKVDLAKGLLAKAGGKIKLPVDNVISNQMTDDAKTQVVSGDIPGDMEGFDIGPKDTRVVQVGDRQGRKPSSGTARWACSRKSHSPRERARSRKACADATAKGATTIIGGGDSAAAVEQMGPRRQGQPRLHRRRGVAGVFWRTGISRRSTFSIDASSAETSSADFLRRALRWLAIVCVGYAAVTLTTHAIALAVRAGRYTRSGSRETMARYDRA
jgi:phosphoglycerate kinase